MRIDRSRLERGLPFGCQVATRYSDLDVIGHVNNVAVAMIFQEGRNRFFRSFEHIRAVRCDIVVASLNIEFASDLFHPDPVEVSVGVLEIGRSSFRLGQVATQNGRVGAYAEVVQVARDGNGPMALPESWRVWLETVKVAASL
jgi:acyl-CoA thioester hydrolase